MPYLWASKLDFFQTNIWYTKNEAHKCIFTITSQLISFIKRLL